MGFSSACAIAIDGKICEMDAPAAVATEDGPAVKIGRGVQDAVTVANNGKVVRAIRKLDFRRNLRDARGQMNHTRVAAAQSVGRGSSVILLAWRLSFAARASRRCAI